MKVAYWHECPECGRTELYDEDGEGRDCCASVPMTEKQKDEWREAFPDEDVPNLTECSGTWETTKLTPDGKWNELKRQVENGAESQDMTEHARIAMQQVLCEMEELEDAS